MTTSHSDPSRPANYTMGTKQSKLEEIIVEAAGSANNSSDQQETQTVIRSEWILLSLLIFSCDNMCLEVL